MPYAKWSSWVALACAVACSSSESEGAMPVPDAGMEPPPVVDSGVPMMMPPDSGPPPVVIEVTPPPAVRRIAFAGLGGDDDYPVSPNALQPERAPDAMTNPFGAGHIDATITALEMNANGEATTLFSTFFGGTDRDAGKSAAMDAEGNVYVVGDTNSPDLPTKSPLQAALAGKQDCWVAKLTPSGELVFATYLGGTWLDEAAQIAVDASGIYVIGRTMSPDFPTTQGSAQPVFAGANAMFSDVNANGDAFVVKLALDGSAILWATYLGGSSVDPAVDIAFDSMGNLYIAGGTDSSDFPTTPGAIQAALAPAVPDMPFVMNIDAFVTKISPDGSSVVASTLLGGGAMERVTALVVDDTGVYLTVSYESPDFLGAPAAPLPGLPRSILLKLSSDLSSVIAKVPLGVEREGEFSALARAADGSIAALIQHATVIELFGTSYPGTEVATLGYARFPADLQSATTVKFPSGAAAGIVHAFAFDASGRPTFVVQTPTMTTFTSTGMPAAGDYDTYWGVLDQAGAVVEHGTYFGGPGYDGATGAGIAP